MEDSVFEEDKAASEEDISSELETSIIEFEYSSFFSSLVDTCNSSTNVSKCSFSV